MPLNFLAFPVCSLPWNALKYSKQQRNKGHQMLYQHLPKTNEQED